MKFIRKIIFLLIALPLAALTLYVLVQIWPERCENAITCESHTNCGNTIELRRICRDDAVYAEGQRNTCINAGTCQSSCETSYEPWLVATCENGCEGGTCI